MTKLSINNFYGADIEVESKCCICGKTFTYRLKERKICGDDVCFKESKRRRERDYKNVS